MDFFSHIARVGKYFIPARLRPAMRERYSLMVRKLLNAGEKRKLTRYLNSGGSYIRWYADRLDDRSGMQMETNERLGRILAQYPTGVDDLVVAKKLGLEPHHTLHEFGCGDLRSGNHFVAYLDAGNYSANDASRRRLEDGATCLERIDLGHKNAKLIVNADNSFDWLDGRTFDYVWAGAVLGHMPEADISDLFVNLRKIMRPGSKFIFTYSQARVSDFRKYNTVEKASEIARRDGNIHVIKAIEGGSGRDCIEVSVKDWFHTIDFFKRIAPDFVIEDVTHLEPAENCDTFPMWSGLAIARLAAPARP